MLAVIARPRQVLRQAAAAVLVLLAETVMALAVLVQVEWVRQPILHGVQRLVRAKILAELITTLAVAAVLVMEAHPIVVLGV
jgi:hypothetical protein